MGIPRIKLTKMSLGLMSVTAISLIGVFQLAFSPFAAAVDTTPTIAYYLNGSCGSTPCGMHVHATRNPSNYHYRAFILCSNNKFLFGGWKNGTGNESNTGSCSTQGGHAIDAGFQYDETHQYSKLCWFPGDPNSGSC